MLGVVRVLKLLIAGRVGKGGKKRPWWQKLRTWWRNENYMFSCSVSENFNFDIMSNAEGMLKLITFFFQF